jgi:hypothetical protein
LGAVKALPPEMPVFRAKLGGIGNFRSKKSPIGW